MTLGQWKKLWLDLISNPPKDDENPDVARPGEWEQAYAKRMWDLKRMLGMRKHAYNECSTTETMIKVQVVHFGSFDHGLTEAITRAASDYCDRAALISVSSSTYGLNTPEGWAHNRLIDDHG